MAITRVNAPIKNRRRMNDCADGKPKPNCGTTQAFNDAADLKMTEESRAPLADEQETTSPGLEGVQADVSSTDTVALIEAITGRPIEDLTDEEIKAALAIINASSAGEGTPTIVVAGSDTDTWLPPGVDAAYVPEANVIIVRPGLSPAELEAAVREEFGEFLAHQFREAGIIVAPGDAGSRFGRAITGEAQVEEDYVDAPSDRGTVILFGEEFEADFRTSGTEVPYFQTMVYFASLDTDGDGGLSADELIAAGVPPEQAERLTLFYGIPNDDGEFIIPIKDTPYSHTGIYTMINDGVVTLHRDPDGTARIEVTMTNVSHEVIAAAMIRYIAYVRFMAAPESERQQNGIDYYLNEAFSSGITAVELDIATDGVLGDVMPLDDQNGFREMLFRNFRGTGAGGGLTYSDLKQILDSGGILIKLDNPSPDDSFLGFFVDPTVRPTLNYSSEFGAYLMGFDADGDGSLDEQEFADAMRTLHGDNITDEQIHKLFMLYSSYSPTTGRGVTQVDAEEMFSEGVYDVVGGETVVVVIAAIPEHRVATALFSQVAEARGIPEQHVASASAEELSAAAKVVFGADVPFTHKYITPYGAVNDKGTVFYTRGGIIAAMSDRVLVLNPANELQITFMEIWRPEQTYDPETEPDTPYTVTEEDHPESANYGHGVFQGKHTPSTGQHVLVEGVINGGLERVVVYVPNEAYEPKNGNSMVVNPLEIKVVTLVGVTVRRAQWTDMEFTVNGNGTTTWTIAGVKTTVKTGGEEDQYLRDYYEVDKSARANPEDRSVPTSTNSNGETVWHHNLELTDSYVDENGDLIEVWEARDNQFRTDPFGNKIPIESEPVISVNGKIVKPSEFFIGFSAASGEEIFGFTYEDPDTGEVKTTFMTLDHENPEHVRAIISIANKHGANRTLTATEDLWFDTSTPEFAALMAFENAVAEDLPPPPPIESPFHASDDVPPEDVAAAEAWEKEVTEDLVMNGVAIDADSALQMGLITEDEYIEGHVFFFEPSDELQAIMTAWGMGDMHTPDIMHMIPPSHKGRSLQEIDYKWGVTASTRATEIDSPYRMDWTTPPVPTPGGGKLWTTRRIEFRPKHASAAIGGKNFGPAAPQVTGGFGQTLGKDVRGELLLAGNARTTFTIRFSFAFFHENSKGQVIQYRMPFDIDMIGLDVPLLYDIGGALFTLIFQGPEAVKRKGYGKFDITPFSQVSSGIQILVQMDPAKVEQTGHEGLSPWRFVRNVQRRFYSVSEQSKWEYGGQLIGFFRWDHKKQKWTTGVVAQTLTNLLLETLGEYFPQRVEGETTWQFIQRLVRQGIPGTFWNTLIAGVGRWAINQFTANMRENGNNLGAWIIDTLGNAGAAVLHQLFASTMASIFPGMAEGYSGEPGELSGRYSLTFFYVKDEVTGELKVAGLQLTEHGADDTSTHDDRTVVFSPHFDDPSGAPSDDTVLLDKDGNALTNYDGEAVTFGDLKGPGSRPVHSPGLSKDEDSIQRAFVGEGPIKPNEDDSGYVTFYGDPDEDTDGGSSQTTLALPEENESSAAEGQEVGLAEIMVGGAAIAVAAVALGDGGDGGDGGGGGGGDGGGDPPPAADGGPPALSFGEHVKKGFFAVWHAIRPPKDEDGNRPGAEFKPSRGKVIYSTGGITAFFIVTNDVPDSDDEEDSEAPAEAPN